MGIGGKVIEAGQSHELIKLQAVTGKKFVFKVIVLGIKLTPLECSAVKYAATPKPIIFDQAEEEGDGEGKLEFSECSSPIGCTVTQPIVAQGSTVELVEDSAKTKAEVLFLPNAKEELITLKFTAGSCPATVTITGNGLAGEITQSESTKPEIVLPATPIKTIIRGKGEETTLSMSYEGKPAEIAGAATTEAVAGATFGPFLGMSLTPKKQKFNMVMEKRILRFHYWALIGTSKKIKEGKLNKAGADFKEAANTCTANKSYAADEHCDIDFESLKAGEEVFSANEEGGGAFATKLEL